MKVLKFVGSFFLLSLHYSILIVYYYFIDLFSRKTWQEIVEEKHGEYFSVKEKKLTKDWNIIRKREEETELSKVENIMVVILVILIFIITCVVLFITFLMLLVALNDLFSV